jgi:hypothetical protein
MTADGLRAKVFQDRAIPRAWRVVKMNEDGGYEAFVIFAGPHARQNAINYARQLDGITLDPVAAEPCSRSTHLR